MAFDGDKHHSTSANGLTQLVDEIKNQENSEKVESDGFDSDDLIYEDELEGIRSFRTFENKGVNAMGSR